MNRLEPSSQTTLLILLGASTWPHSPEFQSSQAFANAARRVKGYFLNSHRFCLPEKNMLDLFDSEKSTDEQDVVIGQFLDERLHALKATGNAARDLLVYFIGHGGFVGRDADFYLAIRRTRMDNPRASSLQVMALADTLAERARYLRRFIILDCCFAAAAFSAFQAGPAQVALEKTADAFEVGHKMVGFPTKGTTLLCSSGHKSPSLILPDGSSTMFTKAFLDTLVQGTPSPREQLTLRDVKDAAADRLSEIRNAPKPAILSPDQSEGDVADVPFFPNPWIEKELLQRIEEEKRRKVAEERQHKAEDERVRRAEEEKHLQAEEDTRLQKAEEERLRKVEEERRRRTAEERAHKVKDKVIKSPSQAIGSVASDSGAILSPPNVEVPPSKKEHFVPETVQAIEERTSLPNQSLLDTASATSPHFLVEQAVPVPPPSQPKAPTIPVTSSSSITSSPPRSKDIDAVLSDVPQPPIYRISRRIVISSLIGLVAVGSSIAVLTNSHSSLFAPIPTPSPTPVAYWGHTNYVNAITWSPDGTRIASASSDKTVQVWNASTGMTIFTYKGHTGSVEAVTWSPDSKHIASGGYDKTVQVWNATDGSHVYTYTGHTDFVAAVTWSPDSKHIASASSDKTVQVWSATDGSHVYTYTGHTDFVAAVTWSPDSKHIASGGYDKTVQVWNASTGVKLFTQTDLPGNVRAIAWSPDGKYIASGGDNASAFGIVQVWDAADGRFVYTYTGHAGYKVGNVYAVAWSPDSKRIALGGQGSSGSVQVWNAINGSNYYEYIDNTASVAVAWSPDGKHIASADIDKSVQVLKAP